MCVMGRASVSLLSVETKEPYFAVELSRATRTLSSDKLAYAIDAPMKPKINTHTNAGMIMCRSVELAVLPAIGPLPPRFLTMTKKERV